MGAAQEGGGVDGLSTGMPQAPAAPETPLAYRAVRGGLWVALSSYWTIGFGFVANILLTRLLSPEAFGTFALATFFAQLLRLEPKIGIGQAFGQYKEMSGEAIGTFLYLNIPIILSGFLLTLLAAPILLKVGYDISVVQVALVLALAALLESAAGLAGVMLDKELRFGPTSLWQSLAFPLSYIPAFWLATHGGGVWSLASQTLTYSALLLTGSWWIVRHQLPYIWQVHWQFNPGLARRFVHFGITVGAISLTALLVTQLDNFLIGTFVGVVVLGFYDRAYRTAQWPSTLLTNMVSRTAFYTYAKLQDDPARLQKTAKMILWLIALLAWPIALVIFITAPDLIVLLYGERWLPSTLFLRILVLISAIKPLWDNASTFYTAIGRPSVTLILMGIQVLVLAIAGLLMTIAWGAIGTCVAVGLAFIVGIAGFYRTMRREVHINFVEFGVPVTVSVLTLLGYLILNHWTPINDLAVPVRVIIKSLFPVTMYFGLTFLFQPNVVRKRLVYIWKLFKGQPYDQS